MNIHGCNLKKTHKLDLKNTKPSESVHLKIRIIQRLLHSAPVSRRSFSGQPQGPFTYEHTGVKMLYFIKKHGKCVEAGKELIKSAVEIRIEKC